MRFRIGFFLLFLLSCTEGDVNTTSQGTGGSLTRFAINDSLLYIVSGFEISIFDISANNFSQVNKITIGFGLETIQAKAGYLYLGARDAMYIYSLSNPVDPQFVFRYSHIVSCDPVVVQGNRAYVTLRSGNLCNQGTNTLEIIDITNPTNPTLLTQYPMTSPGGLGIYGDCLFVCEGSAGLKMLNVANDQVTIVNEIANQHAYDVIVKDGSFIMTGEDGILQYHFNCATNEIQLISSIPVQRAEL